MAICIEKNCSTKSLSLPLGIMIVSKRMISLVRWRSIWKVSETQHSNVNWFTLDCFQIPISSMTNRIGIVCKLYVRAKKRPIGVHRHVFSKWRPSTPLFPPTQHWIKILSWYNHGPTIRNNALWNEALVFFFSVGFSFILFYSDKHLIKDTCAMPKMGNDRVDHTLEHSEIYQWDYLFTVPLSHCVIDKPWEKIQHLSLHHHRLVFFAFLITTHRIGEFCSASDTVVQQVAVARSVVAAHKKKKKRKSGVRWIDWQLDVNRE